MRRVSWQILFLRSPTHEKYLEWLSLEFPRQLPAYERAYAGSSHLEGAYAKGVGALLERVRERHGLLGEAFGRCGRPAVPRQLVLGA